MYWILFLVLGGAAGAHIVIGNIHDYPPPERLGAKLWTVLVASTVIGGGGGGLALGNMIMASDPMPARAIVGAAGIVALGLIVGAVTEILTGLHIKPAGRGM